MQVKQLLIKLLRRRNLGYSRFAAGRVSQIGLGLLVMTGSVWTTQVVLQPQVAQAYKARVDVRLDRLTDETYQSMIRRAEIIARAAAQRSFDRDILMSEVSVMVIGEYQGTEAPLLMLEVSRQNWRERPDARRWATYYRTAKRLLKLPSSPDPVIPNAVRRSAPPSLPGVKPAPIPVVQPQTTQSTPTMPVPVPVPAPAANGQPQPQPTTPATATPQKPQSDAQQSDAKQSEAEMPEAKDAKPKTDAADEAAKVVDAAASASEN